MPALQEYVDTLEIIECTCGVVYGLTEQFIRYRREDHETFYCPHGCRRHYPQESDKEKFKRQRDTARRRAASAEGQATRERETAEYYRRSAAASRGHLTRIKNRIKNGVCPVPGCRRTFQNVLAHMARQHPNFVVPE